MQPIAGATGLPNLRLDLGEKNEPRGSRADAVTLAAPANAQTVDRSLLEHSAVPLQDAAGRMFSTDSYRPSVVPLTGC